MSGGYIFLHRAILDHPVWLQMPAERFKVWIYVLLRANHKETKWWDGTKEVGIPCGAFVGSAEKIAEACNVTLKQSRGSLEYFERAGMLARERAAHYSLFVVTNYATYQRPWEAEGMAEGMAEGSDGAGQGEVSGHSEGRQRAGKGHSEGILRATEEEPNIPTTQEVNTLFADGSDLQKPHLVSHKTVSLSDAQKDRLFTERFWPVVWAKIGVGAARTEFRRKVRTEADCDLLVSEAVRQGPEILRRAKTSRDGSVLHPRTWIHQERYKDERPEELSDIPGVIADGRRKSAKEIAWELA